MRTEGCHGVSTHRLRTTILLLSVKHYLNNIHTQVFVEFWNHLFFPSTENVPSGVYSNVSADTLVAYFHGNHLCPRKHYPFPWYDFLQNIYHPDSSHIFSCTFLSLFVWRKVDGTMSDTNYTSSKYYFKNKLILFIKQVVIRIKIVHKYFLKLFLQIIVHCKAGILWLLHFTYCMCACICVHMCHITYVEVREQPAGAGFLLPPVRPGNEMESSSVKARPSTHWTIPLAEVDIL